MILNAIIPILAQFCELAFLRVWFFPLIALAFLATVPAIIRALIR